MKILVTGGAGYIGAHVTRVVKQEGHEPVLLDDFRRSSPARAGTFACENVALEDEKGLLEVFKRHRPEGIIHLAGYISVGESVQNPDIYWQNNFEAAKNLLTACAEFPVKAFLFSSTAATYGDVDQSPITESAPNKPTCPYGESKLAFEKELHSRGRELGFKSTALRYFNAAGCCPDWGVGEDHDPEEHLIPRVIRAIKSGEKVGVYGNDYPTPDGTCVRDYIHVLDLATAHVLALKSESLEGGQSFNVGTGNGYSVLQVIEGIGKALGTKPQINFMARRAGDPPSLVADSSKLRSGLNWTPAHSSLEEIISSAVQWETIRESAK